MYIVLKLVPQSERENKIVEMLALARGIELLNHGSLEERFNVYDFEMARTVIKSAEQLLSVGRPKRRKLAEEKT